MLCFLISLCASSQKSPISISSLNALKGRSHEIDLNEFISNEVFATPDLVHFPTYNISSESNTSIKYDVYNSDAWIVVYTNTQGYIYIPTRTFTIVNISTADTISRTYTESYYLSPYYTQTETYWVVQTNTNYVVPNFKDQYIHAGVIIAVSVVVVLIVFFFNFCDCCFISMSKPNDLRQENQTGQHDTGTHFDTTHHELTPEEIEMQAIQQDNAAPAATPQPNMDYSNEMPQNPYDVDSDKSNDWD
ncbi:hypothetical protein GPJ56_007062 [Histomonas meleagridis]|uniref:uncharacterized protein n=1 Tax=Histomonas meleagridis TaxID=135588 RepID=UPI0035594C89|nr:hypothetical protein GPJ56_007062 [Histomonas meleagridis]KAH0801717.1 hypothetical protein GO595_005552 [Histomonas meleagridis]